jgi:Tol biopolymer transport system component
MIAFRDRKNIYVVNVNGTNMRILCPIGGQAPSYGNSIEWSPDGLRIVYADTERTKINTYESKIFVINADGNDKKQITEPINDTYGYISAYRWPRWSPDGSKIVFVYFSVPIAITNVSAFPDVYIVNSDGTNQQKLTSVSCQYMDVVWP